MARTILQLVQQACYRSNVPAPSSLIGSSNSSDIQLLHLFYSVGEELRALLCWPQLKRTFKVRLVSGQEGYDLPLDFYSLLPQTHYDNANGWLASGPMTDADWNLRVQGLDFTGNIRAFRFFGTGGRQFRVSPLPGDADAFTTISFDYISKSWIQPPPWTASEGSLTQNLYRSANGIIYKKTDSGSDSAGSKRPTLYFGEGQDGACRLLALQDSSFSTSTAYAAGSYIATGGNLYRVTSGGISGGSAPTSTTEDTDITNGTMTLRYHSAASWAAETEKEAGDYILISAQYYRYETGGKTGRTTPTWTPTLELDNTTDWTFQDIAYEVALADTDYQVFDEELVMAGLRAKFFQSRGLGSDDLVYSYERMKKVAMGRWNAGKVLDLAAGPNDGVAYPSINYTGGNWTVS